MPAATALKNKWDARVFIDLPVLTFCYVDPVRLENLNFATLRTLAAT